MENLQKIILNLVDEAASAEFAAKLAKFLNAPFIISLSGPLGVGKTTLVRALLRSLGVDSTIKSPTFSLVESYDTAHFVFHHFDLYRLEQEDELDYLGFRDYFSPQAVCCIEWPEHAGHALPQVDMAIELSMQEVGRCMQVNAQSLRAQACLRPWIEK